MVWPCPAQLSTSYCSSCGQVCQGQGGVLKVWGVGTNSTLSPFFQGVFSYNPQPCHTHLDDSLCLEHDSPISRLGKASQEQHADDSDQAKKRSRVCQCMSKNSQQPNLLLIDLSGKIPINVNESRNRLLMCQSLSHRRSLLSSLVLCRAQVCHR